MKDIIFYNINQEKYRKLRSIELIAYDNFVSNNVLKAMVSNYAECYSIKRYYSGCKIQDKIEQSTKDRAKLFFNGTYANVQPNSASQANQAVCMACLNPGDTILGYKLDPVCPTYRSVSYGLNKDTELIDYNEVLFLAQKEKPKLIICGASSYSRDIDYKLFRKVADKVGAILLADISNTAGIIAKGFLNDPLLYCHVLTTTTHNTLRGPIGGVIIMREDFDNPKFIKKNGCIQTISQLIDRSVLCLGGSFEPVIAAKGIAFSEALSNTYTCYIKQVLKNSKKLVEYLIKKGYRIISNGTDNHCLLIDLSNKSITGKEAEMILEQVDITCNNLHNRSSVIILGTGAITTRGLKENDMDIISSLIDEALLYRNNIRRLKLIKQQVNKMMNQYPILFYQ